MYVPQVLAIAFSTVTLGGTAIALYLFRGPMTADKLWHAKKTILAHTDAAPELVAKIVRWKLSDPRFTETEETPCGREFHTRYRRDQWTLGVKVHVTVTPSRAGSTLTIQCFPEWFSRLEMVEGYRTELQAFADDVCSGRSLSPA